MKHVVLFLSIIVLYTFTIIVAANRLDINTKQLSESTSEYEKTYHKDLRQHEKQIDSNMPPVGKLEDLTKSTHGTAFIVGPHTIITNYHVVDDHKVKNLMFTPKKKPREFKNNEYVPQLKTKITDVKRIGDKDIAILHTHDDLSKYGHLTLSSKHPERFDETTSYGYPNPVNKNNPIIDYEMTETSYHYLTDRFGKFYVKGVIHPGSSGSPMLNDKGQVYGIASFRHKDDENKSVSGGYLFNHHTIELIKSNTH